MSAQPPAQPPAQPTTVQPDAQPPAQPSTVQPDAQPTTAQCVSNGASAVVTRDTVGNSCGDSGDSEDSDVDDGITLDEGLFQVILPHNLTM